MIAAHRLLALIPARSGSVRVPDKNARKFGGSSLIEIAVTGALQAEGIDHVGFSSDSKAYLELANRAGLDETYLRPQELAGPTATSVECVIDYLRWSSEYITGTFTHVVLLQPTSPHRTSKDINAAISFWRQSGTSSLASVARISPDPKYVICEDSTSGRLFKYDEKHMPEYTVLDGSIFINSVEMLKNEEEFWNESSALFKCEYPRYFDIDTEIDFAAAEAMYSGKYSK